MHRLGGHAMKRSDLFVLLFLLFIGGGVILSFEFNESVSLSTFTGLFAYLLVILIPGRFLWPNNEQRTRWILWVTISVVAAIIWFKMTNDRTIFLYVITGILFWVALALSM
jgi:uncharacterized membrane protein HdeD (DUF308 family)